MNVGQEEVPSSETSAKSIYARVIIVAVGVLVIAILYGLNFNSRSSDSSTTDSAQTISTELIGSDSNAYDIGVSQARSFIVGSGLTRALYDQLGGAQQSCQMILDTFMALQGGSSSDQEYSDFISGCLEVVNAWY